jgi:hypothetical protein
MRGYVAYQWHTKMKHRARSQVLRERCLMTFLFFKIKCTGLVPKFAQKNLSKTPIYCCLLQQNRLVVAKWTQFRQDSRRAKRGEG